MGRRSREERRAAQTGKHYYTVDQEKTATSMAWLGTPIMGRQFGFDGPIGVVVGVSDHPTEPFIVRLTVRLGPDAVRFFLERGILPS